MLESNPIFCRSNLRNLFRTFSRTYSKKKKPQQSSAEGDHELYQVQENICVTPLTRNRPLLSQDQHILPRGNHLQRSKKIHTTIVNPYVKDPSTQTADRLARTAEVDSRKQLSLGDRRHCESEYRSRNSENHFLAKKIFTPSDMQAWKNNGTILSDKGFQLKTCANPKEIDDEFVHDKSDFSLLDLWEKVHPKTIQRQNPSHLKKTRNNLFDVFRNSKYFNRKQKQAANQMILATSATQNDAAITKSRSFCIRPAVPVE